jgi:apolipoprotein N-acyltransferase
VRTARLGRLTISDAYGRLNAEANCSNGKSTNLVGQIAIARIDTFYTQHEDWFGLLMIITTISFILLITIKSKNRQTTNH